VLRLDLAVAAGLTLWIFDRVRALSCSICARNCACFPLVLIFRIAHQRILSAGLLLTTGGRWS
jgi:hypothetical protein